MMVEDRERFESEEGLDMMMIPSKKVGESHGPQLERKSALFGRRLRLKHPNADPGRPILSSMDDDS